MSKVTKHNNPSYISHNHLKGYKSIVDTEVELYPGLNIIIGSNQLNFQQVYQNHNGENSFQSFIDELETAIK